MHRHVKPRTGSKPYEPYNNSNNRRNNRRPAEVVPDIPFTTIMVRNIPFSWQPVDMYNCFSTRGAVIGTFIYYSVDEFGNKYGLVQMAEHSAAYDLCVKGVLHIDETALSLVPTDVKSLAGWLSGTRGDGRGDDHGAGASGMDEDQDQGQGQGKYRDVSKKQKDTGSPNCSLNSSSTVSASSAAGVHDASTKEFRNGYYYEKYHDDYDNLEFRGRGTGSSTATTTAGDLNDREPTGAMILGPNTLHAGGLESTTAAVAVNKKNYVSKVGLNGGSTCEERKKKPTSASSTSVHNKCRSAHEMIYAADGDIAPGGGARAAVKAPDDDHQQKWWGGYKGTTPPGAVSSRAKMSGGR